MPSNQQRREAERLRLQRQLDQRREREVSRRRTTLIVSVVVTLALIGGVLAVIAVLAGGSSAPAAGSAPSSTPGVVHASAPATSATPSPTSPSSSAAALAAPKACVQLGKRTVHFQGVTVANATNLKQAPKVRSHGSSHGSSANALECADLVVGTGKAAKPTSTVSVQYTGVLYKNGTTFDSSWQRGGTPVSFPLDKVIPGFSQGIGGTGKVAPMRVGGRRIIVMPASLAYGSTANGPIPANSTLVFVVDLTKVKG